MQRNDVGIHGDGAIQARVFGLVDVAHAPSAELGLDLVRAESRVGT